MDIKEEQTAQKQEMEKILHTYGLENLLSTNITEDKDLEQFNLGLDELFNFKPEVVFYYLNDPNMQYIINSNYCENINTFFLNNPTLVLKYCDTQFIKDFVERNPEDINKILEANPDYIKNYEDSQVVKQYQEAQELIKQIGLSAENISAESISDEIYDLLELSDNNIFAKQFIEKNQNEIFEKRPDLLVYYNDNKIVKNFVDKLKKDSEQYNNISNALKQYFKDTPTEVISCQNSAIVELYSKDLLEDQDFKTLLDNYLKQPKNNDYFLSQRFENNSFIKDFVERNLKDINKILTENPDSLILYSGSKVVQDFTKNLEQDSEQYKAIKNGLKEYLEKTPWLVMKYQNTTIIEDLLKDQDFKTLLHDTLQKPKNNWFILSREYENNSFIKDFVERNPGDINKILEANPDYIKHYEDSQVVKQYELQKLQKNNTLLGQLEQEFSSKILSNSSTKERK